MKNKEKEVYQKLHQTLLGLPMVDATKAEILVAEILEVYVNSSKPELPVCSPLCAGAVRFTRSLIKQEVQEVSQ